MDLMHFYFCFFGFMFEFTIDFRDDDLRLRKCFVSEIPFVDSVDFTFGSRADCKFVFLELQIFNYRMEMIECGRLVIIVSNFVILLNFIIQSYLMATDSAMDRILKSNICILLFLLGLV